MEAKDIMRKHVITVTEKMTLQEVARLFTDKNISGAAVVSREGNVIGVVSQTDLVRYDREKSAEKTPVFHKEAEEFNRGFQVENPDYTRVEQVMTPWAISFEEKTPIEELAAEMLNKRIHRVFITREGRLCGIVTSMDMIRALLDLLKGPSKARSKKSSA
ncbi:MAG: CBS domain-containing protein [Elusimicrobia bacterium]|nr:CBS domain-containing protein [Elusimicrobiota bacterium]